MGWIRIGTPSKEQSQAGCLLAIIIIVVSIVVIVYNESTYRRIRSIHNEPANESFSSAIQYLERRPNGRYAREASDTLLKYLYSLPSYGASLNEGKTNYLYREYNNLRKFSAIKKQVSGSPAEVPLDSLIRARVDEEYEKASALNTEDGWRLYDFLVPEDYKELHPRDE